MIQTTPTASKIGAAIIPAKSALAPMDVRKRYNAAYPNLEAPEPSIFLRGVNDNRIPIVEIRITVQVNLEKIVATVGKYSLKKGSVISKTIPARN